MRYFDHDTTAMKDELIQALRLECGGSAVDAYWAILELIYRDETDLVLSENRSLTKSVTHWLCIDWETLKTYFSTMQKVGLISVVENENGEFVLHSDRAEKNIKVYQKRLETARENGAKGGRKPKPNQKQTKPKPKPNQTLTHPKAKEKEKEKVLVTHKGLPNTSASDGAAVEESTPPSAPKCLICGTELNSTGMSDPEYWWCDGCKDFYPKWKAAS